MDKEHITSETEHSVKSSSITLSKEEQELIFCHRLMNKNNRGSILNIMVSSSGFNKLIQNKRKDKMMKEIPTYRVQFFKCCETCEHSHIARDITGNCLHPEHKTYDYIEQLGTCVDYEVRYDLNNSDKNAKIIE